jgi:hypothetical protein
MPTADDRADALYGLPLDRFVPERDALAKELRADGDRARADEVRRLPKPTRAAWAVNRAIREHPERARALADSARLLGEAQRELMAGGDASSLREAGERARAAVDALVAAAPASGEATADKVRETLHAATVDPDVLADVAAGRVVREQVASGFGGAAAPGPARGRGSRPRPKKKGGPAAPTAAEQKAREAKEQKARAAAARDEARQREKLRRAKEAEAAAGDDLAAARRALEQVESAVADRRAQVREAQARVKDARRRRERAER